ncbi:hypothetical protein NBT05_00820 [Aquimarina sp. ERC-38]|uniref:hypothetical protein n=1 Tax=Aquimarina sp. ERC-38 TaxID=2949996 RepID=UPI00224572C7|nr:hypothetical protein [Aquimarina sp. ERC-38]UZO81034.1 hypothetical protein NBT05_00820 [Aquimarina sp. ERC-38]
MFFILSSCQKESNTTSKNNYYIPQDAPIVIKINDLDQVKELIRDNDFLNKFSGTSVSNYISNLQVLQNSSNQEAILSLVPVGKNTYEYVFSSKYDPVLLEKDSIQKKENKRIPYAHNTIYYVKNKKDSFFAIEKDSMLIASSSQLLIENSIRNKQTKTLPELEKALSIINTDNPIALLVDGTQIKEITQQFFKDDVFSFPKNFSNWISTDLSMTQQSLVIDGIATEKDSIINTLNLFKGTIPNENSISQVAPVETTFLTSFTYDDYLKFKSNLSLYQDRDIQNFSEEFDELMSSISEFGEITVDQNTVVVLKSMDTTNALSLLKGTKVNTYRDYPIYTYQDELTFLSSLQPFLTPEKLSFFTVIEDFILFSDNKNVLQLVIANFINKTVFDRLPAFIKTKEQLTDASSILLIGNSNPLKNKIAEHIDEVYKKEWMGIDLASYPIGALQFIKEGNFTHIHGIIQKENTENTINSVTQSSTTTLDAPLLNAPQLVYNHRTKGKDIVVQDIENTLYLISSKGTIYWKKKLDQPILGKIEQIDIYKNGRYQLLFATKDAIHLLDRNGKTVAPYPKKLNTPATQALSLFDYDKNKRYRIVITQGSKVTMYDAKGEVVSGFQFNEASSPLVNKPQHIRIGSKDYILLSQQDGKLTILDRVGRTRVKVKDTISFSGQPWYQYQNTFTSLTKNNKIVQVNTKGSVFLEDHDLEDDSSIVATNKTLVSFSGNVLKIKGAKVELDYGVYTEPQIFYVNNKIYVAITDLQTHRVFLFDSNGKMIPNFPIYGNSEIDLANIDKDKNLELVVKGEDNSILIYQMN